MNSTRIYVTIIGILTALVGVFHGIFETMQGNNPTGGVVLENIGAITIIPNYLFTGIAAIIVGLVIIWWVIAYIHRRHGAIIFLGLSVLLILVGGGIALIASVFITWAVASRINKPVTWLNLYLPEYLRLQLSRLWPAIMITGLVFLFIGIGIWLVWLPPGGTGKQPVIEYIC